MRRRAWTLAGCAVLSAALASARIAAAQVAAPPAGRLSFDIPAQPLASALSAYAVATGVSVLFDGRLAMGHRSVSVQGVFAPDDALRRLLAGSHLAANHISPTAFTLVASAFEPANTAAQPAASAAAPVSATEARLVQATLEQALCRSADARPGSYRAVLQLWLDPFGKVQRVHLLQSTGLARRDAAIQAAMRKLVIGALPQDESGQPYTILLEPQTAGTRGICGHALEGAF